MEQHPVPQHIASFQFKLFGNLTARQFISLAIPMTVAGFIFFSALEPVFVKYTLSFLIGGFGAFVALVPVGGRPFDKWLVAFIKAVFAPTQRIWIKETKIPEFLGVVVRHVSDDRIPEEITAKGRERLVAYLKSLPKDNQSPLDSREAAAVAHINFDVSGVPGVGSRAPIMWPAEIETKVGTGSIPVFIEGIGATVPEVGDVVLGKPVQVTPTRGGKAEGGKAVVAKGEVGVHKKVKIEVPAIYAPMIAKSAKPFAVHGLEDRLKIAHEGRRGRAASPMTDRMHIFRKPRLRAHLASDGNFEVDNIISVLEPDNHIRFVRGVGKTRVRKLHFAPPANFDLSKLAIRGERQFEISDELKKRFSFEDESPSVVLPNEKSVVDSQVKFSPVNRDSEISRVLPRATKRVTPRTNTLQAQVIAGGQVVSAVPVQQQPKFSITDTVKHKDFQDTQDSVQILPLTSTPNVISGLITDNSGVPAVGAVLVIRDASGIPVRAMKTNKLGQFLSATPLANGSYTVEVESEVASFRPATFNLSGQVLPPLGLRGEAKTN